MNPLDLISQDRTKSKACLRLLYQECFPLVDRYVHKNSGTAEEAEDIFQEGILVLYQKVKNKQFDEGLTLGAYLVGICKNLWLMKLRSRRVTTTPLSELIPDIDVEVEYDSELIKKLLSKLESGCQRILTDFYYNNLSFEKLKEQMGLGSIQAVKNKKSRCLKYLMNILREYKLNKDNFLK